MTQMPRKLLIVVGVALCGAGLAHAQAPPERVVVEALRDSLAGVKDTAALRRVEAATIAIARVQRDDPMLHLRLGFIAYRLGELGIGKPSYDDAAGEFQWATELRPEWPYAWYGLGLSELAVGEHSILAIENLRQMLGRDYLSKAAKAFARAAQVDPSFASAVVDLANTALTQRIQPRITVALEAVRTAAASPAGRQPAVQLARGRVEREAGEVDSALAGFRAAIDVGADSGVALLELARTLYYARQPAAGRANYFTGARVAKSPAALGLYREDLQWAATADELAPYDAITDGGSRAEWLLGFWDRRDVADARNEGERLAEHYRRWFFARKHFRLVSKHRHYDITEVYRSTQSEFDDRGLIYLRHGEPDRRARYVCPPGDQRCAANESWLYRRPGGDLIFHFAARDDVSDYKLVESLVDVLGFQAAVRAGAGGVPDLPSLYQSRDEFGELYRRVSGAAGPSGPALAEERRNGKRAIAQGTTSDSYSQRFDLPLDAVISEFVVGDRAQPSTPTLNVVFAIPAERLTPSPASDGVIYPLKFRIVVADSSGRLIGRLDTTRVFGARQALRRPSYLTGRLAMPVPPGALKYRLLVTLADGSAGEVVTRDSLVADTLDGRRFAASDIVTGVLGSGLSWIQAPDTIALNPLGNVTEGGSLEVYYQVFGLAAGAPYHTEIEVGREGGRSLWSAIGGLFGKKRSPVRIAFDAQSTGVRTDVHRTVSLQGVARGTYVLTVRLTDPSRGTTLVRTRHFGVVGS